MKTSFSRPVSALLAVAALTLILTPNTAFGEGIAASVASEIKTGEVDDDLRFTNAQGSDNGDFTSYGVLEFDTSSLAGTPSVAAVELSFTQANAFFTTNGEVNFYITDDTSTEKLNTLPIVRGNIQTENHIVLLD